MKLVGCVMLSSNPMLARQAIDSVRATVDEAADPHVAVMFGLGLWNVPIGDWYREGWFGDVEYLRPINFGDEDSRTGRIFRQFSFSAMNNRMAAGISTEAERVLGTHLDYYLFLNDDVHAPEGMQFVSAMVRAHEEADASVVGLKLVYPPNVNPQLGGRIQHAGHYRGHCGTGTHRGLYADPNAREFSEPPWVETWAVTGACVLVTPDHFWMPRDNKRVYGFDEQYETLWQDVDLSLGLRKVTGKPVVVVQDHWIYHYEGATQGGRFDEEPWWQTRPDVSRDRERFIQKWPPWRDGE
ncbi:MAG: glycosyltransferase family 2 protein [Candidatus Eisenbacteria bacterium]|nr:glycosyltransferase family 2 protein [Candidatus Eisenbacteria bacterium]